MTPHRPAVPHRLWLAVALLAAGLACPGLAGRTTGATARGPRGAPRDPTGDSDRIELGVTSLEGGWEVEVATTPPVTELWFGEVEGALLSSGWEVTGAALASRPVTGVAWRPGQDRLRGPSFDRVRLRARVPFPPGIREAAGGQLLELNRFEPVGRETAGQAATDVPRVPDLYRVRAPEDRWLSGAGGVRRGALEYSEPGHPLERSPYLLVSAAEPVRYPDLILALDPALPTWMREASHAFLPRLTALLEALAGRPLSVTPLVALSFSPSPESSPLDLAYMGSGGFLEVQVRGPDWAQESEENLQDLIWYLSHELFHFWNLEDHAAAYPEEDEWLTEGLAEFAARSALVQLGLLDREQALAGLELELGRCLRDLGPAPLDGQRGEVARSCGTTLISLAHAAITGPGQRPEGLAAALSWGLDRAAHKGYRYDRFDLLGGLRAHTSDAGASADLATVLFHGLGPTPAARLGEMLARAGLRSEPAPLDALFDSPSDQLLLVAARVQELACGSARPATYFDEWIRLPARQGCELLTRPLDLTHVDGVSVALDPGRVATRLRRARAEGGRLSLTGARRGRLEVEVTAGDHEVLDGLRLLGPER